MKNNKLGLTNKEIEKINRMIRDSVNADAERLSKREAFFEKRPKTIAQNLRHYRKINKMTQEQFAEKIGVDRTTIINWENGSTVPDALQIEDAAKIFSVDIGDLHTKNVWFYSDSTEERRKYAKLEENWLKHNPAILGARLREGENYLAINNFARDYIWIGKDDYIIIFLELKLRGFNVHEFYGDIADFDTSDVDWADCFEEGGAPTSSCIMSVSLEENQIKSFKEAISEILVDFASFTSKFDEIITLRKTSILSGKNVYEVLKENEDDSRQ